MNCFMWTPLFASLASSVVAEDSGCGPFQCYNAHYDEDSPSLVLQAAFANIDEWVEALAVNLNAPSVSFGVVYDQELIHYTSTGYTNLKAKSKPTPDSVYRIGSTSKVWTVLLAYHLRERGLISMEDPVAKFNPQFSIHNPWGTTAEEVEGKTIALQHLASQVSGLPREAPCDQGIDCTGYDTAQMLQRLSSETLVHPTDVQPSYSNLAYALLGNLLTEHVGHEPYNQTLFDAIVDPMGLNNTGLCLTPKQEPYATTGYDGNGQEVEHIDVGWDGPAGQLFSSVHDLGTLMMQHFAVFPSLYQRQIDPDYKFVLRPQTLREMLRPVFLNPDKTTGFGAPWEIHWRHGHMVRSKGGAINGFRSEMAMIPELKLGIVILINGERSDPELMAASALDILIPAFTEWVNEKKLHGFRAPTNAQYEDMVGVYGVDGQAIAKIHLYKVSGFPTISAPQALVHGLLTPEASKESVDESADPTSSSLVYNDMFSNADYCFTTAISAFDGLVVAFVGKSDSDGKFDGFFANGMFYGLELKRLQDHPGDEIDLKSWHANNAFTVEQTQKFLRGSTEYPPDEFLHALSR